MHVSVAALFPAADEKSVIVVFFFCNKQNNAHHLMHPWPTNPSNSLPHPHLPLLRYAMSLPYFTMAAASAAATPAIASSVALNIFVVVSFYAANFYLQNVNIFAAAGIKVGIPPAFPPAGRRGVCRPRPLRSQRRRRRERNASFAPPPSQRRRWKEGSVSSAPFPTAVGGRRGACRPRPPGRSAVDGGRGARRSRPPRRSAVAGGRGAHRSRPPRRSAIPGGRGVRPPRPSRLLQGQIVAVGRGERGERVVAAAGAPPLDGREGQG